jgi:hypothetical protein
MDERRLGIRRSTALVGRIMADKRRTSIDCTVRDLSDDGARIEVREEVLLPYEFELEVPDMNLTVRTRVAWANGKGYGLMFIGEPRMIQDRGSADELSESPPSSDVYTKSLTLHMSEVQYERLRRFAFDRRLGYQEVVERALRAYLNQ